MGIAISFFITFLCYLGINHEILQHNPLPSGQAGISMMGEGVREWYVERKGGGGGEEEGWI